MRTDYFNTSDVIVDLTGTWVKVGKDGWATYYERIEVVRGKDYRLPRNIQPADGFVGRGCGEPADRGNGREHRKPESKYGVRDHRPMSDSVHATMMAWLAHHDSRTPDSDILKNLRGII